MDYNALLARLITGTISHSEFAQLCEHEHAMHLSIKLCHFHLAASSSKARKLEVQYHQHVSTWCDFRIAK